MIEKVIESDVPFLLVISEELTGTDYSIVLFSDRKIRLELVPPKKWYLINQRIPKMELKVSNQLGRIYDYKNFTNKTRIVSKHRFLQSLLKV